MDPQAGPAASRPARTAPGATPAAPGLNPADPLAPPPGALRPEADEAAQIADEVRELVYDGLTENPELLADLQQMGIRQKLQNRELAARQLRATAQDVLRLIPDRFENRVERAVSQRIPYEYQPLFERFMGWIRTSSGPDEPTGRPKSMLRRVWDFFWKRKDRKKMEESFGPPEGGRLDRLRNLISRKKEEPADLMPLDVMI